MDRAPRDPRLDETAILYPGLYPEPPRRRRWGRTLTSLVVLLGLLLVAGAAGGFLYVNSRLESLRRISPSALTPASGAMTVLVVGSDSRAELLPGQESRFGTTAQVSGKRSDAIMILRTDPGRDHAAVLSIPRDLYVPIAGTGKSNRINVAYAGGPDRLIRTIEGALGISINHYLEVNFDGFQGIVDAIGGLNVYFPAPARDILAQLNVPTAGCVHLSGDQGLAYVRSRHYEYLENGRWRSDPTGDHGRIQRQQDFIRRMIGKAISQSVKNPFTMNDLLGSFVRDVTVDDQLGTFDLVRLGLSFRTLGAGGVEMLTLPTTGARIGGASVLRLKEPEASELIDRFLNPPRSGSPADSVDPSSVSLRVLNGSGRRGEAGNAAAKLEQAGFRLLGTGDASAPTSISQIRYGEGAGSKAELLRTFVIGGAELRSDSSLRAGDVVLVTGRSFGGIRAPSAGGQPAGPAPSPAPEQAPATPDCPA